MPRTPSRLCHIALPWDPVQDVTLRRLNSKVRQKTVPNLGTNFPKVESRNIAEPLNRIRKGRDLEVARAVGLQPMAFHDPSRLVAMPFHALGRQARAPVRPARWPLFERAAGDLDLQFGRDPDLRPGWGRSSNPGRFSPSCRLEHRCTVGSETSALPANPSAESRTFWARSARRCGLEPSP